MPLSEKILVVDDDRDSRLALQHVLDPLGHQVVSASSGEGALKAVLQQGFSLVLLDVVMPGSMDGLQTASYLKGMDQTQHIPIVLYSGIVRDVDCTSAAFAIGAADFLAKPINPVELRAKVRLLTELHTENRHLREELADLRQRFQELADRRESPGT